LVVGRVKREAGIFLGRLRRDPGLGGPDRAELVAAMSGSLARRATTVGLTLLAACSTDFLDQASATEQPTPDATVDAVPPVDAPADAPADAHGRCGDGILDILTEDCEPGQALPVGVRCSNDCHFEKVCTNLAAASVDSPSVRITRSGVYDASYEAWQAFDGVGVTMWISAVFATPAWIAYEWTDGPRTVDSYAIYFINGDLTSRAPRDWTFQGWTGTEWKVIDTRSGEVAWQSSASRTFQISSPGAYTGYRLHVTDDNDAREGVVVISMGALELLSCR
jgi:hypothetical protein